MTTTTVITLFLNYKYPALVVLSFFEGPYIMMMSGFLIKLGVLTLGYTFIALSVGDLLADVCWYYIGYHFGNRVIGRFGKFFDINAESIESAKELFSNHRKKILLGSKMTAGFGLSLATLVTAGVVRAPFGEYMALNFIGQLVWTVVMLAVGYFFGQVYVLVDNVLGKIFIIALGLAALYLLLRLSRRLGRRMKENLIA